MADGRVSLIFHVPSPFADRALKLHRPQDDLIRLYIEEVGSE